MVGAQHRGGRKGPNHRTVHGRRGARGAGGTATMTSTSSATMTTPRGFVKTMMSVERGRG